MSLVREALDKAEREATAKHAREKGLPASFTGAGQPYRARRSRARAAGKLAAASAAVVLAALLAWALAHRGIESLSDAGPRSADAALGSGQKLPLVETTPAPSSTTAPSLSPPRFSAPAEKEPPNASAPISQPSQRSNQVPATESSAGASPAAAAKPANGDDVTARSSPPDRSSAAAPAPRETERFIRDFDTGEGVTLHLGGIAWSAVTPLAYLDRRLVGLGEVVAGFRVDRIERDRVLLSSGERRVWITLR